MEEQEEEEGQEAILRGRKQKRTATYTLERTDRADACVATARSPSGEDANEGKTDRKIVGRSLRLTRRSAFLLDAHGREQYGWPAHRSGRDGQRRNIESSWTGFMRGPTVWIFSARSSRINGTVSPEKSHPASECEIDLRSLCSPRASYYVP